MGIGSLSCLSRLSVLVEVVRMLLMGKKGKPARRSPDQASLAGLPFGALAAPCRQAPAAVLGSLGFHQRDMFRLSGQVGRFGFAHSRRAYRRAERRAKSGLD
jgi:hypothetical protein